VSVLWAEINECPAAIDRSLNANAATIRVLAARAASHPPRLILTVGRGSSAHALAFVAEALRNRIGVPVFSLPLSTASVFHSPLDLSGVWIIFASQSGASPDLLAVAEMAQKQNVLTIGLVNDDSSPLAGSVRHLLPLAVGPEQSIAATKSCLATAALGLALVGAMGDNGLETVIGSLPGVFEQALILDWSPALLSLERHDKLFLVGRGPGLTVVKELALKIQELAGVFTRAISAAEILHGPIMAANSSTGALVLSDDQATQPSCILAWQALRERGAEAVWLGGSPEMIPELGRVQHAEPLLRYLGYQLAGYRLAFELSQAHGRNPDAPGGLMKATKTR
jgi:glucosamine--fructose-6-phosphate aminotransferase (isomerizing)